jgi:TolB-like protein
MKTRNAATKADERIDYRIGVNLGDIIVEGGDIAGDGVNVASRLEALAEPGGICVSAGVSEQVHGQLDVEFVDGGEQSVKNITRPIRVFRVAFIDHGSPQSKPSPAIRWMGRRRWTWSLGLGIALLIAVVAGWSFLHGGKTTSETPASALASAAILPWVSKGASGGGDQLSSQLGDEFASRLPVGVREIRFLAPSLAAVGDGRGDPRMIGRQLGVRFVVEGEVRQQQDRATIRARIIDATNGVQLWADETDFRVSDPTERDVIVGRMVRRTRNAFYDIRRVDPDQSPAMKLVFRADALDVNSRTTLLEARRLYDEALRLDPALLPALLGRGYNLIVELEQDPGADRDRLVDEAIALSARALDLDANDPRAWVFRAIALGWQANLAAALEADARARQLDPTSPLNALAWLMVMSGQPEKALEATERGVALEPRAIANYDLMRCWSYLLLGRYEQAIIACEKWRAYEDRWFYVYPLLTAAYAQSGNEVKAAAAKAELLKHAPNYTIARYVALQKSDAPKYAALTETHILAGLRKAGIPER